MKVLLNLIPLGRVVSYRDLATILGVSPRRVGRILAKNDEPIVIPCHRVIYKDGRLGGYSGPGGPLFKKRLLELEGVRFEGDRVDKRCFFSLSRFLGLEGT